MPILTLPTGVKTGASTADMSVTTDVGDGTLYGVVSTLIAPPSVVQIQAGQDSSGSAAAWSGNQAVTAVGVQNQSATGLDTGETYYYHAQHRDVALNESTVVTSASFTMDGVLASRHGFDSMMLGVISR
jgi:hypothetical protein